MNNFKDKMVFVLCVAAAFMVFLGGIALTTPIHTSKVELVNNFFLNEEFEEVRASLRKNDFAEIALEANGGRILHKENVKHSLSLGLDKIEGIESFEDIQFNYVNITNLTVEIKGQILYLQSKADLTSDTLRIQVQLIQPNSNLGLQHYQQDMFLQKDGNGTNVTHVCQIFVTKRCPRSFQNYMDSVVRSEVLQNLQIIEYVMRDFVERNKQNDKVFYTRF